MATPVPPLRQPEPLDLGRPVGRRMFLGIVGLSAAGIVWGGKLQGLVERLAPEDTGGLFSLIPAGRFRIYSVTKTLPQRSPDRYRLRVSGLVERPLDLSYSALRDLPSTTLIRDFQCVTGWRVPDVEWKGVRLSVLLDRAGADRTATACRFVSFDGTYTETLSMGQARRDDVIVAYEMEGKPVSRAHGGPARLYVAPMYGYKSCKWLEEISVVSHIEDGQHGYWEELGYDIDGWVGRSNGRDDEPT